MEIDVVHRMMADLGEGESGEEGNEEDYTNQNKDGRVEIEKVHPPTTWSTFAAVPLASILLFKRSRKRERGNLCFG